MNRASASSGSISIVGATGQEGEPDAGQRQQGRIGNLQPPRQRRQRDGDQKQDKGEFEKRHAYRSGERYWQWQMQQDAVDCPATPGRLAVCLEPDCRRISIGHDPHRPV